MYCLVFSSTRTSFLAAGISASIGDSTSRTIKSRIHYPRPITPLNDNLNVFMKRFFKISKSISIALFLLVANNSYGQLATYTGTGGTSTAVVGTINETVTVLQDRGFGSNTACGSGGLSGKTVSTSWTIYDTTGPRYFIQILPNPGYQLNVTGFDAGMRVSNTGPTKVRYAYSLDNGAHWIDDGVDNPLSNPGCGSSIASSWGGGALPVGITSTTDGITIALCPFAPGGSTGTFQTNYINVLGTVTPACTPPPPNSGPTNECVGNTITLTNTASGYWSSSNTLVATVGSLTGDVFGASAGTAIISYITGPTCWATTTVDVYPNPTAILGPTAVCEGATITLSDPVPGGSWSSSTTGVATINSTSGVVSGIAAGVTTITYSFGGICEVYSNITVNPSPLPITGITNVCAGFTTTLTDLSTGGVWSTSGAALVPLSSNIVVVPGSTAGTVTVFYTFPGTGCYSGVTVNSNPQPAISGPSTVCEFSTVSLSESPSMPGTWLSGNPSVASVSSGGVVSGLTAGTANITFIASVAGCSDVHMITVNPVPAAITGTTTVCAGFTTTLTDITAGGTWISSAGGTLVSVGPNAVQIPASTPGTVTITYSLVSTGCRATATVVSNPQPSIGGPVAVCQFATINVTEIPAVAGAWTSSNTTVATIDPSGMVTGNTIGTSRIVYTTTAGCTDTRTITVNPLPAAIQGPLSLCQGSSVTLSDPTPGGTWSTSNALVASIVSGTGVVSATGSGRAFSAIATITYQLLATGCFVSRGITVDPQPAVTGPANVCQFASISLTETTGTPGNWTTGSSTIATVNPAGAVTGVTAGTADITFTAFSGGCFATAPVTVHIIPLPISGPTSMCAGRTVTLNSASVGGTWSSSATSVASAITLPTGDGGITGLATGSASAAVSTINYTIAGCSTSVVITINPQPVISGGFAVCHHATLNLTETTGTPGTWNSSTLTVAPVTAVGVVSGLSVGTANITFVASIGGCTASRNVTVNPIPAPITGTLSVCQHSVTILNDADPGGFWSSSNVTVATAGTGNVTGLLPGSPVISYTFPGTSCFTTATVTVIAAPVISITPGGPLAFCPGGNVVLSATPGFTYQWYIGISPLTGETGMNYNATNSGSYSVKATNASGCSSLSAALVVNAGTAPFINAGGLTTFCYGGHVNLFANTGTSGGPITYQWQRNGINVPGQTAANFSADTTGLYTCIVHFTGTVGACISPTPATLVNVLPLPVLSIHSVGSTYLTDDRFYPAYQWYFGTSPVPGANGWSITPHFNGKYWLSATDTNGCTGYSFSLYYNSGIDIKTGTTSVNENNIAIFPNPASGIVHIASQINLTAVISSMEGRVILSADNVKDINVNTLSDGMYILTLFDTDGARVKVEKLVIAN